MTERSYGRRWCFLVAALAAAAAMSIAEAPSVVTIGADFEPLRSDFAAAPSDVRALLLAAPT